MVNHQSISLVCPERLTSVVARDGPRLATLDGRGAVLRLGVIGGAIVVARDVRLSSGATCVAAEVGVRFRVAVQDVLVARGRVDLLVRVGEGGVKGVGVGRHG